MEPLIRAYRGDCLDVMPTLAEDSVDLTVTSPPYDNLRTYNENLEWNEDIWKAIIKELFRLTKQGGVVVWVVGDATINGSETGTSFKQALWAKECGFNLHDTMIWNKGGFTSPQTVRYPNSFEYMFIFSRGTPVCNQIKDRKNKKVGTSSIHTKRKPNGKTKNMYSDCRKTKIGVLGVRFNVWEISPEQSNKKRVHPAQFSEQLAYDHIISWSNEGDVVFDPMMGSGTTGKMAKQLNRNFIGIEKDPEYFEIAIARLEQETKQQKLF